MPVSLKSPFLIIALFSAHPGIPGGCFLYILRDNPLYKNLLLLFSYKDAIPEAENFVAGHDMSLLGIKKEHDYKITFLLCI